MWKGKVNAILFIKIMPPLTDLVTSCLPTTNQRIYVFVTLPASFWDSHISIPRQNLFYHDGWFVFIKLHILWNMKYSLGLFLFWIDIWCMWSLYHRICISYFCNPWQYLTKSVTWMWISFYYDKLKYSWSKSLIYKIPQYFYVVYYN